MAVWCAILVFCLTGCLSTFKFEHDIYREQGDQQYGEGDYDGAIASYTQAIDYITSVMADDGTIWLNRRGQAFFSRGNVYYDKGDINLANANYERAINDFTRTITIGKDDVAEAYFQRGLVYITKEDYNKAIADFTQVIKLMPDLSPAYSNRGNAYFKLGNRNQAIADLNRALAVDPNNQWAKNKLQEVQNSK